MRSAVGTRAVARCYINGLSEMGKWAAAAGDAPGGAEDEAEDERAQGARVGERHRMRERILHGVLEGAKGMVHGVTCGAGMPYKMAQICAEYGVYYYPIVSSARAFPAKPLATMRGCPSPSLPL